MSSKGDSSKKKDDGQYDLEQQFIMRLPPGQAMALNHALDTGAVLKDNLFIDLQPDERWGKVQFGGEVINAKMVDMPNTIETLKTTDNKTLYKTADICQMLICSNDMEPSDEEEESPKKKKEKDKKYRHPHGMCPPLKNVRKRRFRKTLTKKPIDLVSIEKEVKRLLRMDIAASEVKYEEIYDDTPGGEAGKSDTQLSQNESTVDFVDEHEVFGEISSSDDGEGDVNIDDDSDTEGLSMAPISSSTTSANQTTNRINILQLEIDRLHDHISSQEEKIHSVDNPALKRNFGSTLQEMKQQMDTKLEEMERLQAGS